jgi:DNA-binding CsgD family transcriptional regulator
MNIPDPTSTNKRSNSMKEVSRRAVADLTARGWSASRIANGLGCSGRTVARIRKELGLSRSANGANLPASPERLAMAKQMIGDGCPRNEISRTLGMSRHTLERHFGPAEMKRGDGGNLGMMAKRLRSIEFAKPEPQREIIRRERQLEIALAALDNQQKRAS